MRKLLSLIPLALAGCGQTIAIPKAPTMAQAPAQPAAPGNTGQRHAPAGAVSGPPDSRHYDPNMSKAGGTYEAYLTDRLACIRADHNSVITCLAVHGWRIDPKGFPPPDKPVASIDRFPDHELPPDR